MILPSFISFTVTEVSGWYSSKSGELIVTSGAVVSRFTVRSTVVSLPTESVALIVYSKIPSEV